MAFDFKKEYKEFYMPKNKPEIVNVPKANYIALRGLGDPNEEEALERFKDSHARVMEALDTFTQEELFTNTFYPWVGGSCIGSYFISTTSSHYDWAMKKMKAHKKIVTGK